MINPLVRVLFTGCFSLGALALSYFVTGSIIPDSSSEQVLFINALLLVALSSGLIEYKFTKPADSAVNSLLGLVTVFSIYENSYSYVLYILLGYLILVASSSFICISVSRSEFISGFRRKLADITYYPSVYLGQAGRLYSVIFVYLAFEIYSIYSWELAAVLSFWGVFIVLKSMGFREYLTDIVNHTARDDDLVGKIAKTESPNLVRVSLQPEEEWSRDSLKMYHRADGEQKWILPLYSHVQEDSRLGTGLSIGSVNDEYSEQHAAGYVSNCSVEEGQQKAIIRKNLGGGEDSKLAGFVVENSHIDQIRFEIWDHTICQDGALVYCSFDGQKVFYQITEAFNREESLEEDRHGYQVGHATQLGVLSKSENAQDAPGNDIFQRYEWLPPMNTPVFKVSESFGDEMDSIDEGDFIYGNIPGSKLRVGGSVVNNINRHMAILGITGSGKTELTLDIIRHTQDRGTKTVCVDLTGQYEDQLDEVGTSNLSIPESQVDGLNEKIFDVETGEFGAEEEKEDLDDYIEVLKREIWNKVSNFLENDDVNVGIIELKEISNTRATLRITEIYLTSILYYCRDVEDSPQVAIVVEEAHTVMPETNASGASDFESKAIVNRISQIALQGRKYNIGLLVVTQRTATVSKSILTQCNTIVSFVCHDDTSLRFLENIFGEEYTEMVPNLKPLQTVVSGKAVSSSRPLKVQIPYKEEKDTDGEMVA